MNASIAAARFPASFPKTDITNFPGFRRNIENYPGLFRVYAEQARIVFENAPEPREICDIGLGKLAGNRAAAIEAFHQLGEVVGDAIANALTLIDGLAVIGGGISAAWPLFLPTLVSELNSFYSGPDGRQFRRLASVAFNLEDPAQTEKFLSGKTRQIEVPGSMRKIAYDPLQRTGVGVSRLGTTEAVAIGAYAYALQKLDES